MKPTLGSEMLMSTLMKHLQERERSLGLRREPRRPPEALRETGSASLEAGWHQRVSNAARVGGSPDGKQLSRKDL